MRVVDVIAALLLIVGGLNWGLTTLNSNLVEFAFGRIPMLPKIIYILVAIAAIYQMFAWKEIQNRWR
jgi:uncharacterized membrane protein YuzA (DUF378 family)